MKPKTLELVDGYAIMVLSPTDKIYNVHSYWLKEDQLKMNEASKKVRDCKIESCQFYYSKDTDNYYNLPYISEIIVSPPTKEEVLRKLTPKERKVLGL